MTLEDGCGEINDPVTVSRLIRTQLVTHKHLPALDHQLATERWSEWRLNIWILRDANPGLDLIQAGAAHPGGDQSGLHEAAGTTERHFQPDCFCFFLLNSHRPASVLPTETK